MRLIALLLSLGACGESAEQIALDEARAKFEEAAITHYSVVFWYSYPGEPHVLLEVVDDEVVAATKVDSGEPTQPDMFGPFRTVEDQFKHIQKAINGDVIALEVSYDPALGYPTSVSIETELDSVDGPVSEAMRELTALP